MNDTSFLLGKSQIDVCLSDFGMSSLHETAQITFCIPNVYGNCILYQMRRKARHNQSRDRASLVAFAANHRTSAFHLNFLLHIHYQSTHTARL
jgi:hypothetical protein